MAVARGRRGRASARPGNLTPLLRLIGADRARDPRRRRCSSSGSRAARATASATATRLHDRDRDRRNASARLGEELTTTLTTPGLKQEELERQLGGYDAASRGADRRSAEDIDPPGPLHAANEGAVEALQLRVIGLSGMPTAFKQIDRRRRTRPQAGKQLAAAGQRLRGERRRLGRLLPHACAKPCSMTRGSTGVAVPDSDFVADRRAHERDARWRGLAAHPGRVDRRHARRAPARKRASRTSGACRADSSCRRRRRRRSRSRPTSPSRSE